jgi:HK97 family phage major capsid protein
MEFDISDAAPEHKAGISAAQRQAHHEVLRAHDEFKAANDERLAAEQHHRGDVLLEEKVDRISGGLDARLKKVEEFALKQARPALEGRARIVADAASREHKSAFDAYVRSGETGSLRQIEQKAMSVGSNADGGYLVPVELEQAIGRRLAAISPIRSIAAVREISGSVYKKPFMTAGPATGWVGESDARPQTASSSLDALSFPAMELYAMPAATASLLDDAAVDLDEWIASEVDQVFAEQEGTAFITGDGVNKPKGFLTTTAVANSAWSWGNVGYVASGAAGAFPASNPSDVLVDLIYALKAGYRQNGNFVTNPRPRRRSASSRIPAAAICGSPRARPGAAPP